MQEPTVLGPQVQDLLGRTKRPETQEPTDPGEKRKQLEQLAAVAQDADAEAKAEQEQEQQKVLLNSFEDEPEDADLDDPNFYMMFRNTVMDNASVRKEIEARCPAIDKSRTLEGRWTQDVPIIEGSAAQGGLTTTYRTLLASEKDYLHDRWSRVTESRPSHASAELLPIYYAALAVDKINQTSFPELLLEKGWQVAETKEQKKADASFDHLLNKFDNLMDDMRDAIVANHRWFQDRVGREMRRPGAMKRVAGK